MSFTSRGTASASIQSFMNKSISPELCRTSMALTDRQQSGDCHLLGCTPRLCSVGNQTSYVEAPATSLRGETNTFDGARPHNTLGKRLLATTCPVFTSTASIIQSNVASYSSSEIGRSVFACGGTAQSVSATRKSTHNNASSSANDSMTEAGRLRSSTGHVAMVLNQLDCTAIDCFRRPVCGSQRSSK